MLAALLLWIIIVLISFILGLFTVRIFGIIFRLPENTVLPFPVTVIAGLAFMTTVSSYFTMITKIGLYADLFFLASGVIYFITDRKYIWSVIAGLREELKQTGIWTAVVFAVTLVIILIETSLYYPKNFDTALYHAQAIRWIETYPVIPGLGNLHKRFAYNSSWFVTNAVFSFSYLKLQSFHVLNGFILFLGSLYFFSLIGRIFNGEKRAVNLMALSILPVILYLSVNFSSSPGTDIPAAVIIYTMFLYMTDLLGARKGIKAGISIEFILIFFISFFLVTIKLSALPILILSLYIIAAAVYKRDVRSFLLLAGLSFFTLLPWLIRNVIISGYLVYPFSALDIFHVDWKIPPGILSGDIQGIREWSFPVGDRSLLTYIPEWLKFINLQYKTVIFPLLALFLCSLVYYIYYLMSHFKEIGKIWKRVKPYLVIYITGYSGLVFLFVTAPDVRYGSAFFVMFFLIHIIPALMILLSKLNSGTFSVIIKITLSGFAVSLIFFESLLFHRYFNLPADTEYEKDNIKNIPARFLIPAGYSRDDSGYRTYILSNGNYSLTLYLNRTEAKCWYEPFPCITSHEFVLIKGIELRGDSILKGFMIAREER